MLRIVSLNLNGIRSAIKKGLINWIERTKPDILCFQEIKISPDLIDHSFEIPGYHHHFFSAEKKGYSGVAIYSRIKPDRVITGLGWNTADQEGRYLQIDINDLSIASVYLPSGTSGEERQALKYDFMAQYQKLLTKQLTDGRHYILCGDWNIAHKQIDLKNWRGNQKNSGFLPEERQWLTELFDKTGWIDAFRLINQEENQFTWWSNRGQAWAKNVGWRIDYHIISPSLKEKVRKVEIYKDERFSDHAPLIMEYDLVY